MPVHNSEVAAIFDHVADFLEIRGANRFRVRAYRNAATTVRDQSRRVADMVEAGEDLSALPDIGEDLAGKIAQIARTGHLSLLDELSDTMPEAVVQATRIPGIGPKRARALFEALDLASIDDLERAVKEERIAEIAGFGAKTEAKIRAALEAGDLEERRTRRDVAEEFAEPLIAWIREIDGVETAEIAGGYRRCQETVGDLDILAAGDAGGAVIDRFVHYDEIEEVASHGKTRSTVRLRSGMQVDLRVVAKESWGAAMHYFTGSKAHNIAGRRRAPGAGARAEAQRIRVVRR
ncbi:nucleotidyltransferase domain-containing protein [Rhodovulum sp. ES.010]|uniref:type-X family DNA polymerase n=1 Tax=Rhodovulum sp. ES.010 TaxID=1882821 RepID=UPI001C376592|nr:nucleotidyltransferase domain-containing protein [Rhodovulum sp. ES.010]